MTAPVVRITVEDLKTGDKQTVEVPNHEYYLLTTGDCHLAHTNSYPTKGTHVLIIKGRKA